MSYNPAKGFPRIMPSLRYEDVGKALAWLSHVFGLKEHLRWTDEHGIVRHAEMRIETAFIEMAQTPEGSVTLQQRGQVWQSLVVLVDDVDAHYQHAKAAVPPSLPNRRTSPGGCVSTPPRIWKGTAGSFLNICAMFHPLNGVPN